MREAAVKADQFDDRIDVDTDLTNQEVLTLCGRSLRLLGTAKALFAIKTLLALLALIPGLILPWTGKIVVDQVLLQRSFGGTDVRFPPYFLPFVDWVQSMAPMEIMLATVGFLSIIYLFFGRGALSVFLGQGADNATQSEGKLNSGETQASGLLGSIEMLVNIRLTQRLANGLRTRLFKHLARLPMSTLDDHRIGDSVYRVMYDAPDVALICFQLTLKPLFVILGVLISLYLMYYSYGAVSPEMVWIAASLVPITFLITFPISGFMRRLNQMSRASGAATTNAIEQSMSNIHAVQSLGGMGHEKTRIEDKSRESFRRYRHAAILEIGLWTIQWASLQGLALLVTFLVTGKVIEGTMSPGDLAVMFGLAMVVGGSGAQIGTLWISMQGYIAAVRRVFFFVDLESEDPRPSHAELSDMKRGLRFENVGFRYPSGQRALRDINLDLSIGELVAIVGPTGAGKSSLAYLIPGFYRPTEGQVLIDGQDTAHVNVDSLRGKVSYVFQEHLLLSESIRSNLLLAEPDATEADLREACRTAGAMEFIDRLPEGLDTVLGRSGDTLSVGQQQRLCIARGLVRNTKVLILDEPTAALDPRTENALVRALLQAAKDRLVIVIAHRLSTIRQADRIIFLDNGEITDIGAHDALMADPDSAYRRFVELQGG